MAVALLLALVLGASGLFEQLFDAAQPPVIETIVVPGPGVSAPHTEAMVLFPLEAALLGLPKLVTIESEAWETRQKASHVCAPTPVTDQPGHTPEG